MITCDLHVHSVYCDGDSTPREIILSALEKGLKTLGFSAHSYTEFDERYCLHRERISDYKAEIASLKKEFTGKINILCGIEQDYYSNIVPDDYDYIIGSVHYLKKDNEYLPIDDDKRITQQIVDRYFNGDFFTFANDYFCTVSDVVNKTKANMIAHFDLISKFNNNNAMFDEDDARYIQSGKNAINSLIKYCVPFEINTGAISRGYRSIPYPSPVFMQYIADLGGTFIASSDSHNANMLCNGFNDIEALANEKHYIISNSL